MLLGSSVARRPCHVAAFEVLLVCTGSDELVADRHSVIAAWSTESVVARKNQAGDEIRLRTARSGGGIQDVAAREALRHTGIGAKGGEGGGVVEGNARRSGFIPEQSPLGEDSATHQPHRIAGESRALKALRAAGGEIGHRITQRAAGTAQRLPGSQHSSAHHKCGPDLIGLRQYIGLGRVGGLHHLYIPAANAHRRAGNRRLDRDLIARQGISERLLHYRRRAIPHLAAGRNHNHVQLLAGFAFAGRGHAGCPTAYGLYHCRAVLGWGDGDHSTVGSAPGYRPVSEGIAGRTRRRGGQGHALA